MIFNLERRLKRILILSIFLCLLAGSLLWRAVNVWPHAESKSATVSLRPAAFARSDESQPSIETNEVDRHQWPAPETFKVATGRQLNQGLKIDGTCSAYYYVIVVYPVGVDYRIATSQFVFNQAHPCVNGHYDFSLQTALQNSDSKQFYIVRAEQKESGTWFNPN